MVISADAPSQTPQPIRQPPKEPRHYFSLPNWGNKRFYKCQKINRRGEPIIPKVEIRPIEEVKKAEPPVQNTSNPPARQPSNPPEQLTWNLRARKTPSMEKDADDSRAENAWKARVKKREEFRLSLTREEITADFYMLTGRRPRQRPKKRPRDVQMTIDSLFPGSFLSEIKEERYKVEEQQ